MRKKKRTKQSKAPLFNKKSISMRFKKRILLFEFQNIAEVDVR